jgi:hypothetical protein
MVRRGGHWLFISRVCEFVVVVFCFGAIVIVASDDFSNWYGVHYCCLSLCAIASIARDDFWS